MHKYWRKTGNWRVDNTIKHFYQGKGELTGYTVTFIYHFKNGAWMFDACDIDGPRANSLPYMGNVRTLDQAADRLLDLLGGR